MLSKKMLLLVLLIVCLVAPAHAQDDGDDGWKAVIKMDDVYVEMKTIPGENMRLFRASGYIEASVASVENFLRNLDAMKRITFRFDKIDILNEPSWGLVSAKDVDYVYGLLDAPFPVKDRDCVGTFQYLVEPKTGIVTCEFKALETNFRLDKEAQERIRVVTAYGKYTLIPAGKDLTFCSAEGLGDPAGAIPGSVVNLFARYGILYSFKKFKAAAQSELYKDSSAKLITTTIMSSPPVYSTKGMKLLKPPQLGAGSAYRAD